jgi:hypothetical protein
MKALITVAIGFALLSFTPRPARAQACCGRLTGYPVDCGDCPETLIFSCDEGDGDVYAVVANVTCDGGCYSFDEYVSAGTCDADAAKTLGPVAQRRASVTGETSSYVNWYVGNAYVRDCKGRYVAVRIAMARQVG